jgi:hypothetical protein
MLTFRAQFPLNPHKSSDDFLAACRKWLGGSPHSELSGIADSLALDSDDDFRRSELETVRFARSGQDLHLVGMRHEKYQPSEDQRWVLEAVANRNEYSLWCTVQLSVDSGLPVESVEYGKRPYLMKILLQDIGGGLDGQLQILDRPHCLTDDQIEFAADLINANCGLGLPVVYISKSSSDDICVSASKLAQWLAGMAHVVVEPSRAFSFSLRTKVDDLNAYGGAIGIYWPDGIDRSLYLPLGRLADPKNLQQAVAKKIRFALLSQRFKDQTSWGSLLESKAKERIQRLKDEGSSNVDDYIAAFDEELQAKDDKISALEQEIVRLRYSGSSFQDLSATQGKYLSIQSSERDLYQGERIGIILDALKKELASSEERSRRHQVVSDLLDSNAVTGGCEKDEILASLKANLRGYTSMSGSIRQELERLGFAISEDGKHCKLVFRGDNRYSFVLPKSGSDHRGGLNAFAEVRSRLF